MGQAKATTMRMLAFFKSELLQIWQAWTAYNPERHYMRGPVPKWHEKHDLQGDPPMRIDGSDTVVSSHW